MFFLKVYIVTCHNWFLILGKRLYEMRTDYERFNKDIEMTQNDRTIAKDWTVYTVTVRTMDAGQDKNREIVPQRRRMLKICLFGNDTLMSM